MAETPPCPLQQKNKKLFRLCRLYDVLSVEQHFSTEGNRYQSDCVCKFMNLKDSAGLGVMRALGRACTKPNFRAFSGLLRAFSLLIFCGPQAAA